MSDGIVTAERRHVFHEQDGPAGNFEGDRFAMRLAGSAQRFSLRISESEARAARQVAGFDLTQPINTMSETSDGGAIRFSTRLGPDEWLLIAEDDTEQTLATQLSSALPDRSHTLVDVSHRNIAIELTGSCATGVLNTGCPLNLGDKAFPEGTATRTLFAKAETVLMRRPNSGPSPIYRVECWRSFGRYIHAHLQQSFMLTDHNSR